MCKYCENQETFHDKAGDIAEIRDFTDGFILEVKSDGTWADVYIMHCPWCGRELR